MAWWPETHLELVLRGWSRIGTLRVREDRAILAGVYTQHEVKRLLQRLFLLLTLSLSWLRSGVHENTSMSRSPHTARARMIAPYTANTPRTLYQVKLKHSRRCLSVSSLVGHVAVKDIAIPPEMPG